MQELVKISDIKTYIWSFLELAEQQICNYVCKIFITPCDKSLRIDTYAAKIGNMDLLLQFVKIDHYTNIAYNAALYGHQPILNWLKSKNYNINWYYKYAAEGGHLHILQSVKDIIIDDSTIIKYAIKGNHFEIVKWLKEINYNISLYGDCYNAVRNNNLPMLKWL